jgi:hypothetical protein
VSEHAEHAIAVAPSTSRPSSAPADKQRLGRLEARRLRADVKRSLVADCARARRHGVHRLRAPGTREDGELR